MNLNETTNKQRTFVLLALAATVVGLMLMACGGPDTVQPVPAGAKPAELTLAPCQFKTDGSEYAADCGTLVVPENRAKPASRLIALPVIRVRATGNHPAEPIFWLTGGPGQSNMKFPLPAWLLANHDFVMVGYRGVDGSSVLNCPEYDRVLRSKSPGGDALGAESLANAAEAMAQCAARLQAAGVDLVGYSTPEVVADMEAAREALHYERVNLLSGSYGTRVAQMYAYLHPDRLYRSVMSAASVPGGIVMEPERLDAQLRYYARLCARDAACSARTPDLAETMRRVAHNMPRRWLFLPIDPGNVKVVTVQLLYSRSTASIVFDAYLAAEHGDPSGLALMSLAGLASPGITWGAFFSKAYSMDYDPSRDYPADMDPAGSILGSPYALGIWSTALAWPVRLIPAELRQVHPSNVETLLINGSVDVAAPAERATEELLPSLSKGQQVILAEMSHGDLPGLEAQPRATQRLITSFYDTGVADDSLYTYAPIDFQVSWGYPVLAKLGLGLVLLIMAIVAGVISLTIRRLKRRMALGRRLSAA
ncbi:MAG TPA: alpha/beta fold hydrolase [Roseiflexaceae bacterium]|nr:alpha/beta fold hydrolase [Roseiflexaceae bacterium]